LAVRNFLFGVVCGHWCRFRKVCVEQFVRHD
jgi:hypothetical protein